LTSSTEWRQYILLLHTGQTNKAIQKKSEWLYLGVLTLHGNARLKFLWPFHPPAVEVINWLHTLGMGANFFAEGFDALVSQ
jgi:hypothetical protein